MGTQLAAAEARPDERIIEITALRDRWVEEVDCLSSDRSVFSVQLKTTHRQLGATKTEAETVYRQLTEWKRFQEELNRKRLTCSINWVPLRRKSHGVRVVKVVCSNMSTAFQGEQDG